MTSVNLAESKKTDSDMTEQSSEKAVSGQQQILTIPDPGVMIDLPKLGYYAHNLPIKDKGIQSEFNFTLEAGISLRKIILEINRKNIQNINMPVISGLLLSDRRFDYAPESDKTVIVYQLSRGYYPDPNDGKSETICSALKPAPLEVAATFLALYAYDVASDSDSKNFTSNYFMNSTLFMTNHGGLTWSREGFIQTRSAKTEYSALLCIPKQH